MSTALLISAVALPVSMIAFAVLYADHDSFWPVLWLDVVLPAIWFAAAVLILRDAFRRRSWQQIISVAALIAPTVLLINTMDSPRFWYHQLFTFRPLDLNLPTNGFVLMEKFMICPQAQPCKSRSMVTETRTFSVKRMPDGCCSLAVLNGRGKEKADAFRVVLNGKEVKLESQKAAVDLSAENEISVQLSGVPGAYVYILVSYTGKKDAPPS
jgi:hypothetical protein